MIGECEQLDAFYDDELPSGQREKFLAHLATCPRCQAELEHRVQLTVATHTWGTGTRAATQAPVAAVLAIAPARRRLRPWLGAGGLLAAAAAAVLILRAPGSIDGEDDPIQLADASLMLPPQRSFEPRLSFAPADLHRPYEVMRSGGPTSTTSVSLSAMQRLEQAGDLRGLAAARLLNGELAAAAAALEQTGDSPATRSDRAALALARGDLSTALADVDAALAADPSLAQAHWNRGLVLRALGLPRAAAAEFDQVAALAEPGWSDEARERAAAARREPDERTKQLAAIVTAGAALVADGTPLPEALVDAAPGMARLFFYDALRAAPSAARVQALRPLAERLDARAGTTVLQAQVDRLATADFTRRAPRSAAYRGLANMTPAAQDTYLAALRREGWSDLLIGTLVLTDRLVPALEEFTKLAEKTGDPWFLAIAGQARGERAIAAGDYAGAEAFLQTARAACDSAGLDYRCARIEQVLADLHLQLLRLPEAEALLDAAQARVLAEPQWDIELELLYARASAARLRSDLARTRAIFAEALLRLPADPGQRCAGERFIFTSLADIEVLAGATAAGRAYLGRLPDCGAPPSWLELYVRADLAQRSRDDADIARVLTGLAELTRTPTTPGGQALAHYLEGRVRILADRTRGQALLRQAITLAEPLGLDDPFALKARAFSYGTLVMDAGERNEPGEALAILAEEIGIDAPTRCGLGVAVDHTRTLVVGVDATGTAFTDLVARPTGLMDLAAAELVPPALATRLRACDQVDVLARAPIAGQPALLPADLAWSYRVGQGHLRRDQTSTIAARRLVIADVRPPASLGLAALAPWHDTTVKTVESGHPDDPLTTLTGAQATPRRVLAELPRATTIELHAHGLVNPTVSDAAWIALSPEPDGHFTLTARDIRELALPGHPLVILGACHAGQVAPYLHEPWSLPMAFVEAGASAVIASPEPLPDRSAEAFFAGVRTRVRAGEPVAIAVMHQRAETGGDWADRVLVFR